MGSSHRSMFAASVTLDNLKAISARFPAGRLAMIPPTTRCGWRPLLAKIGLDKAGRILHTAITMGKLTATIAAAFPYYPPPGSTGDTQPRGLRTDRAGSPSQRA